MENIKENKSTRTVEAIELKRSVGVIVMSNWGRMLTGLRCKKEDPEDTWGFPGGSVEEDETPIQVAQRKLKEETGIDLPYESFKEIGTHEKKDVCNGKKYVDHIFVVLMKDEDNFDTSTSTKEFSEFMWAEKLDLECHKCKEALAVLYTYMEAKHAELEKVIREINSVFPACCYRNIVAESENLIDEMQGATENFPEFHM